MDEPESKWLRNLVNRHQTPQERRDKYFFMRCAGVHYKTAHRARDWTWSHIFTLIENIRKYPILTPGAT